MDVAFKELAGIHGVIGVLWIIMIFWFYTAVSAYSSSPGKERADRLFVSGTVSRIMGGLAIFLGIVVLALSGYLHSSFSFFSIAGAILSVGIVLAIISYVVFGEGFAMRLAKNVTPEKVGDLKKYVTLELLFAVLALIFMAVGTSI